MIRGTNIHSRGTRHYGERASSDRVDPMPALGRSWGTLVPLPAFLTFASLDLGARTVPIVASVVLHASLAAGLVATAGGHARATSPAAEVMVEVELAAELPVAPVPTEPAPPPLAEPSRAQPPPSHTHAYPVEPSHDARPHDPSLPHDHEDHHEAQPAAPAAAPPALVAEGAALPRFDLSSGSGAPMGARVAVGASGTGLGEAAASSTAASDDVVHAASSVQVAARLVRSVAARYPIHARADELEADVEVEVVVDREGRVVDARVSRPAGHGFDEAALAAVRAYRFSPAQREGRAVRVRMPWSVQFRLR